MIFQGILINIGGVDVLHVAVVEEDAVQSGNGAESTFLTTSLDGSRLDRPRGSGLPLSLFSPDDAIA